MKGNVECVSTILQAPGVDTSVLDDLGLTPLDCAVTRGNREVAQIMREFQERGKESKGRMQDV